jgi:hypothetical protein
MLKPVSRLNVKIAPATVQAAKPAQPARPLCSVRRIRRAAQINSSGKNAITRRLCQNQMARASSRFTAARARGDRWAWMSLFVGTATVRRRRLDQEGRPDVRSLAFADLKVGPAVVNHSRCLECGRRGPGCSPLGIAGGPSSCVSGIAAAGIPIRDLPDKEETRWLRPSEMR